MKLMEMSLGKYIYIIEEQFNKVIVIYRKDKDGSIIGIVYEREMISGNFKINCEDSIAKQYKIVYDRFIALKAFL